MDTTVLEVETVESVPYQGRVVAILMGMGNLGVVYLRLLKLERDLLRDCGVNRFRQSTA